MRGGGWFRDSYRHSLAARGVKTNNYYASKSVRMHEQELQLLRAREEALANLIEESRENRLRRLERAKESRDFYREYLDEMRKAEEYDRLLRAERRRK